MSVETLASAPQTQKTQEQNKHEDVPESLRPIRDELNTETLEVLNNLNKRFDDLYQEEQRIIFNSHYKQAVDAGRASGVARTIASTYITSPKGRMQISRNAQVRLTMPMQNAVGKFMGNMTVDNPDFQRRREEVYNSVFSVASMPEEEWLGYQYTDKNGRQGYTGGLYEKLRKWVPEPSEASAQPEYQPSVDDTQEIPVVPEQFEEALEEDLEEDQTPETILRDAAEWYKQATANRQRAPLYKRRKANREYRAARQAYGDALADFQTEEIARMRAEGKTNAEILEWVEDHANNLSETDVTDIREELVKGGGWIARQLEKYANASTKKKILIGLGVGALMGVAGFGVGAAAGAVGAGAAIAGAFVGAGRFARTYAMGVSRIYSSSSNALPGGAFGIAADEFTNGEVTDEILDRAVDYIVGQGDAMIEKSDKVRRRAVAFAVGSVAVGSGAGIVAHHAADWVGDGKIGWSLGKVGGELVDGKIPVESLPPINPDQPFIEMQDQLVPSNPNAQELFSADAFKGGADLPIRSGDGFEKLADRYGLNDEQLKRLKDIIASKPGETYGSGNDLRLNLGDGKVHLTSEDVQHLFGSDKPSVGVGEVSNIGEAPEPSGELNQLVPDNPNAQKLFTAQAFEGGVRVPVEPGDGFESLASRYGFDNSQLEALKKVVSSKIGETYTDNGDIRLRLGDRGFNLTASELKQILSAK